MLLRGTLFNQIVLSLKQALFKWRCYFCCGIIGLVHKYVVARSLLLIIHLLGICPGTGKNLIDSRKAVIRKMVIRIKAWSWIILRLANRGNTVS